MIEKSFVDEKQFKFVFNNIQSEDISVKNRAVEYLENYYFTEEQIEKLTPYFTHNEWSKVSSHQHNVLSEKFIRMHANSLVWLSISFWWKFDVNFTREMKNKLDWRPVCSHLPIDNKFVREFYDYIKWHYIALFQKFNFKFVKQWKMELRDHINDINENKKITEENKEKYIKYLLGYEK